MTTSINRTFAFLLLIFMAVVSSIFGHHIDATVLFAAAMIIAVR
jgi:hypothetical protein